MEILKYKEYEGTAELDMSRGVCRGKILFIDDVVTYESPSPAKLQREFEAAVDDYIETCTDLGRQPQRPLRGQFNVRIPPALHKAATLRALKDNVSLNDVVVQALDKHLSDKQEVNHNVTLKVDVHESTMRKIAASASEAPKWEVMNVH